MSRINFLNITLIKKHQQGDWRWLSDPEHWLPFLRIKIPFPFTQHVVMSVPPVPGYLMLSSDLQRHQSHTWCTANIQTKYPYTKQILKRNIKRKENLCFFHEALAVKVRLMKNLCVYKHLKLS